MSGINLSFQKDSLKSFKKSSGSEQSLKVCPALYNVAHTNLPQSDRSVRRLAASQCVRAAYISTP